MGTARFPDHQRDRAQRCRKSHCRRVSTRHLQDHPATMQRSEFVGRLSRMGPPRAACLQRPLLSVEVGHRSAKGAALAYCARARARCRVLAARRYRRQGVGGFSKSFQRQTGSSCWTKTGLFSRLRPEPCGGGQGPDSLRPALCCPDHAHPTVLAPGNGCVGTSSRKTA